LHELIKLLIEDECSSRKLTGAHNSLPAMLTVLALSLKFAAHAVGELIYLPSVG
jgi:hypothetical protein